MVREERHKIQKKKKEKKNEAKWKKQEEKNKGHNGEFNYSFALNYCLSFEKELVKFRPKSSPIMSSPNRVYNALGFFIFGFFYIWAKVGTKKDF